MPYALCPMPYVEQILMLLKNLYIIKGNGSLSFILVQWAIWHFAASCNISLTGELWESGQSSRFRLMPKPSVQIDFPRNINPDTHYESEKPLIIAQETPQHD